MSDTASLPLSGQVALVTGSGRGLGRMIIEGLRQAGADIVLHDISEEAPAQFGEAESLTALARQLSDGPTRATSIVGDITNEATVASMVAKAEAALGPISILVNCAGGDIGPKGTKPFPNTPTQFDLEDIQVVTARNLFGTMLMCRAIAPGMAQRQGGVIINIASVSADHGIDSEIGYACAKAAVMHYTRCLALEMRPNGVRVNAISPGPAMTARFLATRPADAAMMEAGASLNRYAKPAEIADGVVMLALPQARFISGQVLRVDGGAGLYPG